MCAQKRESTIATDRSAAVDADVVLARFLSRIQFTQAVTWDLASPYDQYVSLCRAVRDQIVDRMMATQAAYQERKAKRVYYLSLEYLLGRFLRNNLVCLGLYDEIRTRLGQLGVELERLCELEPDAGLGNGGLGRLAACFLDSATTLELPLYGYGIRYEYGIFEQEIVNGWQVERPECWLRFGSPVSEPIRTAEAGPSGRTIVR
jgi:starch phosphorylase